jgi:hypothetical protein
MNNYYLFIIILLLFTFYCLFYNTENLENTNIQTLYDTNRKCCKVSKVWNNQATFNNDNYYKYHFEINNNCDPVYDSNIRIINPDEIINNKPFTIDNCNESLNLGSCRKIGFECLDFMTQDECSKYDNMIWSKKLCNQDLPGRKSD